MLIFNANYNQWIWIHILTFACPNKLIYIWTNLLYKEGGDGTKGYYIAGSLDSPEKKHQGRGMDAFPVLPVNKHGGDHLQNNREKDLKHRG